MKTRLLDVRAWVVFLVCLNSTACFQSLDGTKVRCTSSTHCPDNFVCSAGKCISRSTATLDGGPVDTGIVTTVDSSVADGAGLRGEVAALGPDADAPAVVSTPDGATTDTSTVDLPYDLSSNDTTDVPLLGTGGVDGAGGIPGSGGRGGSTGGGPGNGGVIGSGGIVGSGGTVATGGVVATGGIKGSGGTTTCQTKSRDCTSALDNNCDGTPDNQETAYCACTVGQTRACQTHPGYDGTGICKAGSQSCAASGDKTTSAWGTCTGSVAPGTRNCTSSVDNDCNGTPDSQETTYCQCTAGNTQSCTPAGMCTAGSHTCAASSDNTTTGWGPCTGYTGPTTQYRDADLDGYGNPAAPAQVCAGTSGYVSNADDCDDTKANFKPGTSICSTVMQQSSCISGGGGTPVLQPCNQGCMNGICRSDGTIGVPGYVSCTRDLTPRCLTSEGCESSDGLGYCGTTGSPNPYLCDGPNDCPGQKCWAYSVPSAAGSACASSQPDNWYYQVCDPLASDCVAPLTCTGGTGSPRIYLCQ